MATKDYDFFEGLEVSNYAKIKGLSFKNNKYTPPPSMGNFVFDRNKEAVNKKEKHFEIQRIMGRIYSLLCVKEQSLFDLRQKIGESSDAVYSAVYNLKRMKLIEPIENTDLFRRKLITPCNSIGFWEVKRLLKQSKRPLTIGEIAYMLKSSACYISRLVNIAKSRNMVIVEEVKNGRQVKLSA